MNVTKRRQAEPPRPASLHAETPQSWVSKRYSSFDGLRGLAILCVFMRHYPPRPWRIFNGFWVGVDLFFVLSGFLITGILYDSRREQHFFRTFYVRRALRIFPLYYAVFGLVAVCGALKLISFSWSLGSYLVYLENVLEPFLLSSGLNPTALHLRMTRPPLALSLGYLWSLCVEEQFYLLWPFIVRRVQRRKALMWIAGWGIFGAVLSRSLLLLTLPKSILGFGTLYSLPFCRCDSLLIGAWLSLWLRGNKLSRSTLRRTAYLVSGSSASLLAFGLSLTLPRWPSKYDNPFITTVGYTLIALVAAGVLLLSLDESSWVSRIARWPWLVQVGAVSYGIYILHALPEAYVDRFIGTYTAPHHLTLLFDAVFFVLICCLAQLSFHYFERPFLQLKDRFAPASHPGIPN